MFEDRPGDRRRGGQLPDGPAAPPLGRERHPPRARLRPPDARRPRASSGVALSTALLLAWLVAVARATGLHPRRLPFARRNGDRAPRRDWDGDRIALVAAALIAVVFGLQSAIDWTWFVPGPTAMALVAAGFVAGRAPLGRPPSRRARRWPRRRAAPARRVAACCVAAVLAAWAIWQPEAADRETGDAIRLADAGAGRRRDRQDRGRGRLEPAQLRAAADARRRSRPGGPGGRRPQLARAGRAQVPRRARRPGTGWPLSSWARWTGPSQAAATCRGRSTWTRAQRSPRALSSRRGALPRADASRPASQRVARASSVPERRRSDSTSKPRSSSTRRSERRVKRRRCGESGSPGRTSGAAGGRGQRQLAAGHQHAPDLRQEQLQVAHVLGGLRARARGRSSPSGERQRRVGLELDQRARPAGAGGPARARRATRPPRSARPRRARAVRRPSPQPRSSARSTWPSPRTKSTQVRGRRPGSSGTSSHSSSS